MGAELILSMIFAGMITSAWENSKRRARAQWEQKREDQREKSRQRAERAEARAAQARRRQHAVQNWFHSSRRNPKHPVSWAYGLGWGLAAAGAATVAGVRGAREGAARGAREGATIGRRAAREGWGHATAWREWRRQRRAEEEQAERGDGEPTQAGTSTDGSEPETPVWVGCRGCGAAITQIRAQTASGLCPTCFPTDTGAPFGPQQPHGTNSQGAGDGADTVVDAELVDDLPTCRGCGAPIRGPHHTTPRGAALCGDCRDPGTTGEAGRDQASDADTVCPRFPRRAADGPIYPYCATAAHDEHQEDTTVTTDTSTSPSEQSALTSGHDGGEMGIEDTRTIYTKISQEGQVIGELMDRLATALQHYGASSDDIAGAQRVAEAAHHLLTIASTERADHDARNAQTEEAAVTEPHAVRDTDYHRKGK